MNYIKYNNLTEVKKEGNELKIFNLGNKFVASLPLGYIYTWPFSTPPEGSIIANGSEYSRELYSDLWNYISSHSEWIKTEEEWQSIASSSNGYCPYYSSGDGTITFRTPKFAPYQQLAISSNNAGLYHEAGLPNITGEMGSSGSYVFNRIHYSGAMYPNGTNGVGAARGTAQDGNNIISFNASLSSDKYGKSTTVQPESNEWVVCIVAYGNISQLSTLDSSKLSSALDVIQANPNLQGIAHLIESWTDETGNGWYKIYSDGWLEQGGYINYDGSAIKTISFFKPYYGIKTINVTCMDVDTIQTSTVCAVKSANSETLTLNLGSTINGVYWEVRGYKL